MGFTKNYSSVEHNGEIYRIKLETDIKGFEVTLNGTIVTDSKILGDLYGTSKALGFIERMLRSGGAQEHVSNVVGPAQDLLQQVTKIHGLEFTRDALGVIAGAAVAAYTAGAAGFVGGGTTFKSAIAEAISKAGSTILNIEAKLLDFALSGSVIEMGEKTLSLGISTAESLVDDINSGKVIKSSDVKLAADASIDGYRIIGKITDYMATSGALEGNAWSDAAALVASAGTTFLGVLGFSRGVTPVEKAFLGVVSFVGTFQSLGELTDTLAKAYTEFTSKASMGSPYFSNTNLREYEDYFETGNSIQIAPTITDIVEVTTGDSEYVISDARIYISEMVFLEGYSGQQGYIVQLSEPLPHDVTFRYSIYDLSGIGQATDGSDFTGITGGTFVVPAGTTQAVLPVSILNDSIAETLSETVYLAVYDPSGATLDGGSLNDVIKGYIVDDDIDLMSSDTRTVSEIIEDNNASQSGEPVVNDTTGGSNLVAVSFGAISTSASPGATVVVTYTITNSGDEVSGRGRVQIISARSSDLQSSKTVAESFEFPSLNPGETRIFTKEIDLSNYSDGDTYLGIEVSSISLGHDVITSDNVASVPFHIEYGISGNPDLRPTKLSNLDGQVFQPGQDFDFSYRITTNAEGSPPYTYRILYSTDEYVSSDDVVLYSETTARGLGYVGVHYYNKTLSLPGGANDGVGYLIVDVDPNDAITETNEANNVRIEAIVVSSEQPDANTLPNIVAEGLTVGAPTLIAGQSINFKAFAYLGSPDDNLFDPNIQSASSVPVHLFLSEDSVFDTSDVSFYNTAEWVEHPIGDTLGFNVTFSKFRTWVDSGEYFVFAVWDYNDEIAEDNESDNVSDPLRVGIVNNSGMDVEARPDTIEITVGEQAEINITSNDTSTFGQEIKVNGFANSSVYGNGYSFTDASGVALNITQDGLLAVDTSGFNVILEPGGIYTLDFQYLAQGQTDWSLSLSDVRIVLMDPRPALVVPIDFRGTANRDVFVAADTDDLLYGYSGNDKLLGGSGDDKLFGGKGDDVLRGQIGADKLTGGRGEDTLLGGGGKDILKGQIGTDTLKGGSGKDRLIGGLGQDTLFGGAGRDVFVYKSASDSLLGADSDMIQDFVVGTDRIHLGGLTSDPLVLVLGGPFTGTSPRSHTH